MQLIAPPYLSGYRAIRDGRHLLFEVDLRSQAWFFEYVSEGVVPPTISFPATATPSNASQDHQIVRTSSRANPRLVWRRWPSRQQAGQWTDAVSAHSLAQASDLFRRGIRRPGKGRIGRDHRL